MVPVIKRNTIASDKIKVWEMVGKIFEFFGIKKGNNRELKQNVC